MKNPIKMVSRDPLRLRVQTRDVAFNARQSRDALLTVPTEAEWAAYRAKMGRTDIGQVWDGVLDVLRSFASGDKKATNDALENLHSTLQGYERAGGGPYPSDDFPGFISDRRRTGDRRPSRSMIYSGRQKANDAGSSKASADGLLRYIKEKNIAAGYRMDHPNTPPQAMMNEAARQFWNL